MVKFCAPASDIHLYQSIKVLPSSWDACLPEAHPMRSMELALYESIQLPDIQTYYVLFGSVQQPKAIAYFQLLKVLPKHLNVGLLQGFQASLAPICLGVFKPSLLIAGHLFRHDIINFHAVPSLSALDKFRAYEAMIQAVAQQSSAMATLIKDVPDELVPYFQNFAPHYSQLRNDISMQMAIPSDWQDFSQYEQALKHKYAQKLRKVRSSLKRLDIRELNEQDVAQASLRIFELYQQVSRHQTISLGLLNEQFLPQLKSFYGEKLKVWGFYEGTEMVAFASAWVHPSCFDMFYIGFDYLRNTDLNLYFNILYFSIEQAIHFQKTRLNLGRTALEAKARLGCKPHYLPTFLYVRNVCIRALVSSKINLQHAQEGAWEQRHPLKMTQ